MGGSERQAVAGGVWRSTLGPCVAGALGWLPPTAVTHGLDTLRVRWQLTPRGEAGPSTLAAFARATVASEGLYGGVSSPLPLPLPPDFTLAAQLYRPAFGVALTFSMIAGGLRVGLYPFIRDGITQLRGADAKAATTMLISGSARDPRPRGPS